MSIKPKYSSTDSDAGERCETAFFIWDVKDRVVVEATRPAKDAAWPIQVLRVVGPSQIPPPNSPMTEEEYTAWRHALESAGFELDVRFK